jgi:nitrite reductase (NADH) large subunit
MHYLIIGNGVAGTTAAENIRKYDPEGAIAVFTDEAYPFYSRIRLIDFLADEVALEKLQIRPLSWYESQGIRLFLNTPIVDVDAVGKTVLTRSGERHGYDKLLLADGSRSFVPPIPGAPLPGVFTLRNIKDALAIKAFAQGKEKALVIGGGLLGLEAANSLRKRGMQVTVVEFFPRLLPRQTDPACSALLQGRLEAMGFTFFLGASSKEIRGEGQVRELLLEDGRRLDCDLILISAGVRPNLDLAQKAGIKTGKGVPVTERMETEIPGIYAAGDGIEFKGMLYGIWPASEKQGEVAGMNMAGREALYQGTTLSNQLKVAGMDLLAAGNIDAEGKAESFVDLDREKGTYRKIVIENDRIVGVLFFGTTEGRRPILKALEEGRNISGIKERLRRFDLQGL